MKLIQPLNIKVYEFKDLSETVQKEVINDQINFWLSGGRDYDEADKGDYEKAIDEANRLQTPWFTPSYVYDYCKNEVIEEIEANAYLYDESGEMLPIYHIMKNEVKSVIYKLTKTINLDITIKDI